MKNIDKFEIKLDKPLYIPGDIIRVFLMNNNMIINFY